MEQPQIKLTNNLALTQPVIPEGMFLCPKKLFLDVFMDDARNRFLYDEERSYKDKVYTFDELAILIKEKLDPKEELVHVEMPSDDDTDVSNIKLPTVWAINSWKAGEKRREKLKAESEEMRKESRLRNAKFDELVAAIKRDTGLDAINPRLVTDMAANIIMERQVSTAAAFKVDISMLAERVTTMTTLVGRTRIGE